MSTHAEAGTAPDAMKVLRVHVYGTVRGVGFRPVVDRITVTELTGRRRYPFLSTTLLRRLAEQDLDVHIGHMIPVNDGGISHGQAVVAAARMSRG